MEEIIVLIDTEEIRVEKIISKGESSPIDFWYDSPFDEWVHIWEGSAVLELENSKIHLNSNDSFFIKSQTRHRVDYTSKDCVWLCIYFKKKRVITP